jgi:hypothetical protein
MLLGLFLAQPLWAHEGHDHNEAPLPVLAATPRFEAASEDFELVGNLQGHSLTIYLDRFATDAPVEKAALEVEAGKQKVQAREAEPGVYRLDLADIQPGRHPLVFTIQAGETSDLLTANLEIPAAAAPVVAVSRFDWRRLGWLALPLFGALGWWRMRWRNRHG